MALKDSSKRLSKRFQNPAEEENHTRRILSEFYQNPAEGENQSMRKLNEYFQNPAESAIEAPSQSQRAVKWEIKRLWVGFDPKNSFETQGEGMFSSAHGGGWFYPASVKATEEHWSIAEQLALEGWELVSAAPFVKGYMQYSAAQSHSYGTGTSVTHGVMLFFKRPKE